MATTSINLAIPTSASRFLDNNGTVSRDWYIFLSTILQAIGGQSVSPGQPTTPVDNQMQFEEYPLSVPDAQEALRAVDELRNELSSVRSNYAALQTAVEEVIQLLPASINIEPLRARIEAIEGRLA